MKSQHCIRASALLVILTASLPGGSTINSTNKYAYCANAGWVNFLGDVTNGVVFGEFFLGGNAYGANFGWINFGDGSPANGIQYQNNIASDCGVNHDGLGTLSGYAYGANIGWINFEPTGNPRVNLLTGEFSGYAYSANMGWINLGAGYLFTDSMTTPPDTDGDGIPDAWEKTYFGNLTTATLTSDFDKDGAMDKNEYLAGTAPNDPNDYFKFVSTAYNGAFTQATVVFTTDASRLYRLETSDALGVTPDVWTNSALGTFVPDAGATTTKVVSWPGTTKKFIRAVAVKPLQ